MVCQFTGPQLLLLHLHQLCSHPSAPYHLTSSHRLHHILLKLLVSLERLWLLISLSCLPPLEILLPGYLTQVPLTIWSLIILFLQIVLLFLIQPIYTLLMVHLLQSLSLVTLLSLLIRWVDSPYLLSFAFLNLSWNYYLLANSPIIIAMSYLHPLLILFRIALDERLR